MFFKVHILFVGGKMQYMIQGTKDDVDDGGVQREWVG